MAKACGMNIATVIEEKIYIAPEINCGELAYPKDCTDCVLVIDAVDFNAQSQLIADRQLRPTRSRRIPMLGKVSPAEFTLKTYVKPSGEYINNKLLSPQEGKLLKYALGIEEYVPKIESYNIPGYHTDNLSPTGITQAQIYRLKSTPESFSLQINLGHTVYAISGSTINEVRYVGSGDKEAEYTFSGNGMKLYRATVSIAKEITYDGVNTYIKVENPEYFTPAMKIYLEDATGNLYGRKNGYTIKEIIFDTTSAGAPYNHYLVIEEEITATIRQGESQTIYPQIPEGCIDYGYPQFGKYGITLLNGQPMIITSQNVTLKNNIKYYDNEKNGVPFATAYGAVKPREVDVEVSAYFRPEFASFYYKHYSISRDTLLIPAGDIEGRICEQYMPNVVQEAPSYRGNEEVEITLKGQAISYFEDLESNCENNSNNELYVIYR